MLHEAIERCFVRVWSIKSHLALFNPVLGISTVPLYCLPAWDLFLATAR